MALPDPIMDQLIAYSCRIMADTERDGYPDEEELRGLARGCAGFYKTLQMDPRKSQAPPAEHQKQMNLWCGKHAEPKVEEGEEGEKEVSEFTRMRSSIRAFTTQYQCPYSNKTLAYTSPYKTMKKSGKF